VGVRGEKVRSSAKMRGSRAGMKAMLPEVDGLVWHLICSMDWRSGLRPPWQQKIFSSTMAATGRQLKQSVNVFHSLMLYRRLPEDDIGNWRRQDREMFGKRKQLNKIFFVVVGNTK